ncbi:patatin-like phospholipase domain-containing protein 5 [Choloepus didactylus]|uniref:patatin-like phospholipase domain-containing protein 5 n=1 Tax=Choloepus didactylus TaxID=27675 RepID=UPI00189F97EE|nr:patatin-like phospholipase domain-containing protein 5 [Choloepus didactylus]
MVARPAASEARMLLTRLPKQSTEPKKHRVQPWSRDHSTQGDRPCLGGCNGEGDESFSSRLFLFPGLALYLTVSFLLWGDPPKFRGEDPNSTITVSPFHGTVDICPWSTSASLHELNAFSANFQISTKDFYLGVTSLFPSKPEVVADHCRQGYPDALRFLERCRLTKEPVLWTLVPEEPTSPAVGTQDAGHDQDEKSGLALNWAVPNVVVKDVPNFEQLSRELEATMKRACEGDLSIWTCFSQSRPVWVLKYLLLPCTLLFEYVYFQSRRVVAWLPKMPVDLGWVQGLLRIWALDVYSRMKAWFGPVRHLGAGPLQPGAAPPAALTLEPLDAHRS